MQTGECLELINEGLARDYPLQFIWLSTKTVVVKACENNHSKYNEEEDADIFYIDIRWIIKYRGEHMEAHNEIPRSTIDQLAHEIRLYANNKRWTEDNSEWEIYDI